MAHILNSRYRLATHITNIQLMSHQLDKDQLRQRLLSERRSLPQKDWREKSDRLCDQLQSLPLFQTAQTVLAYFSFRQEPDLSPLFASNRQWGFPRCVGKSLVWHSWLGEQLQVGKYGIQEPHPDSPLLTSKAVDLILVPALACDYQGYRLGYGGGFYDRFLSASEWASKPTLGIVFDCAYLPQLPVEPWDIKLGGICTETGSKCI